MVAMLTISGFPSSGKSTRAKELATFFETKIATSDAAAIKRLKVAIINDESLNLSKSAYDGASWCLPVPSWEEQPLTGTFVSSG